MKRFPIALLLAALCSALAFSQSQTSSSNPESQVPRLVNFSGMASDGSGKPLTGLVGITFSIYQQQQGGAPLWIETQNVALSSGGRYAVMLGATQSEGVPVELFTTGEARWIGVQVQGQAEQPRVLLLSVPYALKAADAETVGGLPPSAFVLAAPPNGSAQNPSSPGPANLPAGPNVGGSGTQNYLSLWIDNSGDLGNSILYQSGTTAVGINTTTPAATLDVNGGVISRGSLQLPSTGTATASQGYNSQPLDLQGSAFNSSTGKAIGPLFQWQTEPVGNDTSSPSGSLNLLYGNGSGSPSETGLNIASTGLITFAKGQTFPGTGTITGVKAGTGLSGGGTSGTVTLSINTTFANEYYAQLGAANTFTKNQTVNANLTAQQLISTVAQGTAPLQVTSTTQVPNLNASLLGGLPASAFAQLVASNTFTGNQTVNGNVSATGLVSGTAFNIGSNLFGWGSYANSNAFLGFAGNTTTTGNGNTATGYQALNSNTAGTWNTANGGEALYSNAGGYQNTGIGANALYSNTTGYLNTATGSAALSGNTTGNGNTASGSVALASNTTGSNNTAIGSSAGITLDSSQMTSSNNTFLGYSAAASTGTLANATAIGAFAEVSENNAVVLGCASGVNGCPAAVNVGIGTATPAYTLDVQGSGRFTQPVVFASNQTFPGAGTITGVTAGTGLSGGGTSGTVTLNNTGILGVTAGTGISSSGGQNPTIGINTSVVPQLNTANTFTGNQTVNGNVSATGLVTGTAFNIGSNLFGWGSYANSNALLGFAGNTTTTGNGNTAIGYQALIADTTGYENTANGDQALDSNTTGYENTAMGYLSLYTNGSGAYNVAVGDRAGMTVDGTSINANFNTFLGSYSWASTGTLTNATAVGAFAEVSENNAVVLGCASGVNGCPAAVNVGIGTATPAYTLDVQGSGRFTQPVVFASNQTFPGSGTITGVTAGTGLSGGGTSGTVTLNNTGILGVTAGTGISSSGGQNPTIGINTSVVPQLNVSNTFTGNQTVNGNLTATGAVTGGSYQIGSNLFAFGSYANYNAFLGFAGNTTVTGGYDTASGFQALYSDTTGFSNTAIGYGALYSNTAGYENTATGFQALDSNTTGDVNTATGYQALYSNTTAQGNTATGYQALYSNTTGGDNSAVGYGALYDNTTGTQNTAVGAGALAFSTTGYNNTASGYLALYSNTIGADNTAGGFGALYANTTGGSNTAVGVSALGTNTTGYYNTAVGTGALASNTTGSDLTCIGYNCSASDGLTNATAIGAHALVGHSNSLVLGGTGKYAVNVGIGTTTPSNILTIGRGTGHPVSDSWETYSSRRWKTNIQTLPDALAKVEQLRGVSYDLKDSGKHEIGVIAEEVGAVVPEVVTWEKNGKDAQAVDYGRLTALLIEATKEQQALIRKQQQQIRTQQAQLRAQQSELNAQHARGQIQDAQIAELRSQVKAIQASLKTNARTGSEIRTVKAPAPIVQQ